jgi:hypothetical protein
VIALGGLVLVIILLSGAAFAIRDHFTQKQVDKTKAEAEVETTAAQKEKMDAGEISIERKAEDKFREHLNTDRKTADLNLTNATNRRRAAESSYEKTRTDRRRPTLDDDALRRRNCSDLAQLYPDESFAGCQ